MQGGFTVHAISTRSGAERWSLSASNGLVNVLPDSNQVVAQAWGHAHLRRFDGATGAERLPPRPAPSVTSMDRGAQVHAFTVRDPDGALRQTPMYVAVSPDGGTLAVFDMLIEAAHLSVYGVGAPRDVLEVSIGGGLWKSDEHWQASLRAGPDGARWAVATSHATVELVDRDGRSTRCQHEGLVHALAFTPSGDRLLTATRARVRLLDARSGAVLREARFQNDAPGTLWIAPDGSEAWVDTAAGLRVRLRL